MSKRRPSGVQENRWLASLDREDYALLEPHLSYQDHDRGALLYDAGEGVECVYFPGSGVVSLMTVLQDGDAVETAAVGAEGLVGVACGPLSRHSATRAIVQAAGSLGRMDAHRFGGALKQSAGLRDALSRYTEALFVQVQQAAACNALHRLEARLARWLLTFHDRVDSDELPLTQEFLSEMLGVRRATVSDVGALLERRGLIRRTRGRIEVADRAGLERAACECYGAIRRATRDLLGDAAPAGRA